jgi:hypothetical protein
MRTDSLARYRPGLPRDTMESSSSSTRTIVREVMLAFAIGAFVALWLDR